jgi:hypothetical protein
MKRCSMLCCAAALATILAANPALADPITLGAGDIGSTFTFDYDGFKDGNVVAGLGGSTTFKLTAVSDNSYSFDYTVANTTGDGVTSRISSFAFDTDAGITSASSTGAYSYNVRNRNYPNGIGNVDSPARNPASPRLRPGRSPRGNGRAAGPASPSNIAPSGGSAPFAASRASAAAAASPSPSSSWVRASSSAAR